MAYFNFLLSVPVQQVAALRADDRVLLRPSRLVTVSQLVGMWVKVEPLGHTLSLAVADGLPVNDRLWHPWRPPVFHNPEVVRRLRQQLDDAWADAVARHKPDDWGYAPSEIEK